MKKFFSGLIALAFAFTAFAFTKKSPSGDPCNEANKRWFLINLNCDEQIQFSDLTASGNYFVTTSQTKESTCTGSTCICAIFACSGGDGRPIISSGTSIYTALSNYYNFGILSPYIAEKDDIMQAARKN